MKKQQKDKKVKKDRREKLRYIREVSAEQRGRILLSCLTGILGVAFALAFIYATKRVIDTATGITDDNLTHVAVLTVVLLTAQLLCGAADTWISTRMQIETGNALRHRLFSRLLQSRWNELERFHTGDVVNRVEQDTAAIVTLLTSSVPAFIVTSIQLLAAFLFFYFLDPSLPWLIVAILPVFLLGSRFYMRRMKRYTHDIRNSDGRIQSVIQESLQHRIVIKTLEQGERHLDKLDDLQDMLHSQVMGRTRFSLSAHMLVALAFSGGYLTAFLWGAVHLSAGCITFGTMTAFLQLVGKVQRPVLDLSRLIPSVVNALTAIDRLLELERLPAEADGDSIFLASTPELELKDVTFRYTPDDRPVFSRFSCRFPAGSCIAVVGETGKGKTTLIRLLLALATPQEGQILLIPAKHPLETSHTVSPQTRKNFVYVPQGNTLFSGTIRDNLLMGNPQASEEAIYQALQTATADFVFHLPDGVDSPLSERGGGLSEGQAQRIAIARALLRPGNILLLDEATSALDPDTERLLIKNLRRILARIHQSLNLVDYTLTVFRISHTEPLAGCIEHFAGSSAIVNQLIHHQWDEEFALQVLHVLRVAQEALEKLCTVSKVIGSKAPEVHADRSRLGSGSPFTVIVDVLHLTVHTLNLGTFYYGSQQVVCIRSAQTTRYGTAFAQCITDAEAYHGIYIFGTFGKGCKKFAHYLEGITTVEIVAVDNSKRFLYYIGTHHYSMVGSPRFGTAFGASEAFGKVINGLEYQFARNMAFVFGNNLVAEILLKIFTDNKHKLAKACIDGIVNRIIHDSFAIRAQSVQLFQATITAAHAGCQ